VIGFVTQSCSRIVEGTSKIQPQNVAAHLKRGVGGAS